MSLTISWGLAGGGASVEFPALEPATRSWSMGSYPITLQAAWGIQPLAFRHGLAAAGHTLSLGFQLLTATEAALIRTHYHGQRAALLPFGLPEAVWRGHTSPTGPVPGTTQWRYAQEPGESHRSAGLVDVSVELVSVL